MAHLFISYSRRDIEYVRKVVESLLERGFDVWFDAQIEYGDNWESAIFKAIDEAAAVVVIMSPDAAASSWVPREIAYAENRGKPIFPLLLAGEVFPRLILTQFADVRAGALPRDEYYLAIAKALPPRSGRGQEIHIELAGAPGFVRKPPTPSVQERRLESAMPRQSARGVPTEVRVKISRLETAGLRGELPDLTEYGDEIKKDDVRAATFPLAFPRTADGTLQPVSACIQVTSEQYGVQYPPNACGEGAAEVEIQPEHDTRTIIFTLLPRDAAYLGRAAVMVRLLVEGRVIAENLVATRISEQVTEHAFALASVDVSSTSERARDAMSAPTRPVATVDISKTVQSSALTVPINIEKRLQASIPPAPSGQSGVAPSPALSAPTPPMPQRAAGSPASVPQPARARKSGGGMMRYGGLLGILLAAVVGALVLQTGGSRVTQVEPTSVTSIASLSTVSSPTLEIEATALSTEPPIATDPTIRGFVGSDRDSSTAPPAIWVGNPDQGLRRAGTLDSDTEITVLSKTRIRREWYLQIITPDDETVWIAADDVTFLEDATLDAVPDWEA